MTRPIQLRWNRLRRAAGVAFALVSVLPFLLCANLLAGQSRPSEYSVKAAYLLNFGKFMRLSQGAQPGSNDFNICVVGEDPFGGSLDEITAGEKIDGRAVRVIRMEKPDARGCAIAYLGMSEQKRMDQDLAAFRDSDTLTVSDAPDFLKHGGMIQFQLQSDHVRFAVNLDPVRRTHLVLSSELLRVAASVSGNRQGEVQP
ncbi:MAG TPA: YfiR family protein [Terracidiphilus sp.]|nr:YfiR family protein [Terracidiphilus sp.]